MNFSKKTISFGKITLSKKEEDGNSPSTIGSFGAFKPLKLGDKPELSEDEIDLQRAMGFSSFSGSKKEIVLPKSAKNFDVKEMVEAIKKTNRENKNNPTSTDNVIKVVEEKDTNDEDDDGDDVVLGPMPVVKAFGEDDTEESDEECVDEDGDNKEDDGGDSETEARKGFPLEHQYSVEHGNRPVTALSVDLTATRFATGSLDYEVKFWDFTGLRNRHAFRTTKPCENHPIKHVSFATNGESLLVISGSAQAKVLSRDGSELLECVKGDQYIVDMAKTVGHTAALSGGMFNPKNKSEFMTCSDDSTVRLWEVEYPKGHKTLVKLKNAGGLKNRVTACTYSRDGVCFMGGGMDGTICMWDTRKPLVLPTFTLKNAHTKNTDIFHIVYSNSGSEVASRGEDGIVNIFDTRNWRKPIFKSKPGEYPAKYFTTDLTFSPDDRHILIPALPEGTTGRTKEEAIRHSSIKFFSTKKLSVVKEHHFPNQTVIRSAWHHRINQIMLTFASGSIGILYDSKKSQRGALLAHGKGPKTYRKMGVVEDMYGKVVITPNSLPLYKTERSKNPKREAAKSRADPIKSRRPDLPITAGTGGRVAASGSTLSSYVIKNLGLSKSIKDDMDPREAILRYAKDAEENPIWITPAYKKTQPKPIFQQPAEEEPPESKKTRLM